MEFLWVGLALLAVAIAITLVLVWTAWTIERKPDRQGEEVMEGHIGANGECKHLNFIIRSGDLMGQAYCPDCLESIHVSECFQNLADEMRGVLSLCKEVLAVCEGKLGD